MDVFFKRFQAGIVFTSFFLFLVAVLNILHFLALSANTIGIIIKYLKFLKINNGNLVINTKYQNFDK